MHDRGQHDQNVEDVVRAAPNVEFPRSDGLGIAGGVEEGSQDQDPGLEEIIGHS